ncbi:hypothetical protein DQ04_12041030, partial [Trypanosoma grayi]|uniref:hypothetical protein n=1 Tax=Trypanosoma grayi TaxID=71804 RepID=UPI0004F3EFCC
MLRHVLCVLALALCCCTSLCVAAAAAELPGELQLATGDAKITLTGAVDATNCRPQPTSTTGETKTVTISTAVTFAKGASEEKKIIPDVPSETVKVPVGHKLTLKTSLDVKCTKKDKASSSTAEENCPSAEAETADSDTITYVFTVTPTTSEQTSDKIPETQTRKVKVPAGSEVKLIANVVATCAAVSVTHSSTPSTQLRSPGGGRGESLDSDDPERALTTQKSQPSEQKPLKTETDNHQTQGGQTPQQSNTPVGDPSTGDPRQTDQVDAGESSNAESKDVPAPTSSEAESTEADNSVPV